MALAAWMMLQTAAGTTSAPKYLRYQRAVNVPAGVSGTACAVLDGAVFAHAESRAGDDLRVFGADGQEVPFALTENEPQPDAAVQATVQNLGEREGAVAFDLAMPSRAYSEVDLNLDAKDFVATAEVTGESADGKATKLGTFTLFDLTSQHLSRATELPLVESTFPKLHVVLRAVDAQGSAKGLKPEVVKGATVPPSREAQALYTEVAASSGVRQDGHESVARFKLLAHVPVERVRVELAPGFAENFLRPMTVQEGTEAKQDVGEISRTKVRMASMPLAAPVDAERLAVDAVLAGNLRNGEEVRVAIENGDDKPLPIQRVVLEMRQRKLCFAAGAGQSYTLRYGDAALRAPVYDYARLFDGSAPAAASVLGAEELNAAYIPRSDVRPYTERHPEWVWIALLGVVAVLGATAVSSVKHQARG